MKGYKGFEPGLICRGKQYAENTVFKEDRAEPCASGMHFCEDPFEVLRYYPLWEHVGGKRIPVCVKTEQVDGEKIKEDTLYMLKGGEFTECE